MIQTAYKTALAVATVGLLLGAGVHQTSLRAARPPLRVLIVGGGPDAEHTQAAIESNVRYTERLLPQGTERRVLFADGNPATKSVQYLDTQDNEKYRTTLITDVNGPAKKSSLKQEIEQLSNGARTDDGGTILLYFTGHGGPAFDGKFNDNTYELWGDTHLTVTALAKSIQTLPKKCPLVLVMVQCFSGAFGNLLFENGDPSGPLVDRPICGFFASVAQRMAAGCTPNVNEEDYKDFTGEFFAALTGTDRMGRHVTGVDYNHDGKVGMDEAFAYSLLHEESIDTPVCTSDVFLRRFVPTSDETVFQTKFADVLSWARPAQKAALTGLSSALGYMDEDRGDEAYRKFRSSNPESEDLRNVRNIRFVRLFKSVVLAHTLLASQDAHLKQRFGELIQEESQNPLRP